MLKFTDLNVNERLLDALNSLDYTEATPIQEQSIPIAIEGSDILGLAQTGTGKTLAFAVPMIQKIVDSKESGVKALIIAPTRELADQINETVKSLTKFTTLRSLTVYGGVNRKPEIERLKRKVDIIVGCPGRLLDHLREKHLRLDKIQTLVLDEADTMCDMGFLPDITKIIEYLPKKRQTLFFAATMPAEIKGLTKKLLVNPKTIQVGTIAPASTVSHSIYPISEKLKENALLKLLETTATGQVMIFTRTKHRSKRLYACLEKKQYRVTVLQGNMSQNKRKQAITGFRSGKFDILVATDIASRGIDINDVTHVINYDIPNTVDAYIHRIGRTGRASKNGEAFTFTLPEDRGIIKRIEKVLNHRIESRQIDDFDYKDFDQNQQTNTISRSYRRPFDKKPKGSTQSKRNVKPEFRKRSDRPYERKKVNS